MIGRHWWKRHRAPSRIARIEGRGMSRCGKVASSTPSTEPFPSHTSLPASPRLSFTSRNARRQDPHLRLKACRPAIHQRREAPGWKARGCPCIRNCLRGANVADELRLCDVPPTGGPLSPFVQIVDKLKTLTLLEAAELVKEIETTFGVDAR